MKYFLIFILVAVSCSCSNKRDYEERKEWAKKGVFQGDYKTIVLKDSFVIIIDNYYNERTEAIRTRP